MVDIELYKIAPINQMKKVCYRCIRKGKGIILSIINKHHTRNGYRENLTPVVAKMVSLAIGKFLKYGKVWEKTILMLIQLRGRFAPRATFSQFFRDLGPSP
jgi:hypothetical protein